MPLDFIRSIIPRRLQHRDGEEIFSSLPADQASGKATSCALQDPPPPYASESHALDDDKKPFDYPSSIQPATAQISTRSDSKPSSCGSIQVCPHATSSFERIQRVVRLPDFKQSYKGLDALTPGPDHRNPFSPGFKVCKPDSGSDLKIEGWGKYLYDKYGTAGSRKDKELSGTGEGLVLQLCWTTNFLNVPREQRQSREDISHLLSLARVEICTHLMLSNPMIVAAVYQILHPEDDDIDPIDMWEAGCNNGTTTVACDECATVAAIRGADDFIKVDTKKYLGRVEDSTDPSWLAQCGVGEDATIKSRS